MLLLLVEIDGLEGVTWNEEGSAHTGVQEDGGWIFLFNIGAEAEDPEGVLVAAGLW